MVRAPTANLPSEKAGAGTPLRPFCRRGGRLQWWENVLGGRMPRMRARAFAPSYGRGSVRQSRPHPTKAVSVCLSGTVRTGSRGGRAPGSSASGYRRCRLYASTGRYGRQKKGGTARLSRLSGTGGPCRHQLRSSRSSRGIRLKMPPPRTMPTSSQRLPVSSCRRARRRPWSRASTRQNGRAREAQRGESVISGEQDSRSSWVNVRRKGKMVSAR